MGGAAEKEDGIFQGPCVSWQEFRVLFYRDKFSPNLRNVSTTSMYSSFYVKWRRVDLSQNHLEASTLKHGISSTSMTGSAQVIHNSSLNPSIAWELRLGAFDDDSSSLPT